MLHKQWVSKILQALKGKKKNKTKNRNSSLSKIDSMHTKTIKIMDNKSLGGLTLAVCNFSIKNCHLGIPTLAYLKVCIKLIQILWKKYILKNETSVVLMAAWVQGSCWLEFTSKLTNLKIKTIFEDQTYLPTDLLTRL